MDAKQTNTLPQPVRFRAVMGSEDQITRWLKLMEQRHTAVIMMDKINGKMFQANPTSLLQWREEQKIAEALVGLKMSVTNSPTEGKGQGASPLMRGSQLTRHTSIPADHAYH